MPPVRTVTSHVSSRLAISTFHSKPTRDAALMFPEFSHYLTASNDQIYTLLEDNEELCHMVNVIELVEQSNRNLEEIRCRQEQFLLQQFQCALDKGLKQCIQPLVRKKRRRGVPRPLSPSSTAYTGSPDIIDKILLYYETTKP
jgi:hypothetical protein